MSFTYLKKILLVSFCLFLARQQFSQKQTRLLMRKYHRTFFCILDDTSFGIYRIQPHPIWMQLSCCNMGINRFCQSLAVSLFLLVFLVSEQTRIILAIAVEELQQGKLPLIDHQFAHTMNHYTAIFKSLCIVALWFSGGDCKAIWTLVFKHFTSKGIVVSSGSRARFSIVSLASLVFVSILAASMCQKTLQVFCWYPHTTSPEVIVLIVVCVSLVYLS